MLREYNGLMIEGEFVQTRDRNYRVYDKTGREPYEVMLISVRAIQKPFCMDIRFRELRQARKWIRTGCEPLVRQKGREVIWVTSRKAAIAEFMGND